MREHRVQIHGVQIHAGRPSVIAAACQFADEGLRGEAAVVLVSTAPNLLAIRGALGGAAIDVDGAAASGRLTLLDADAALASCMSGGAPQQLQLQETFGAVIARAGAAVHGRPVRIWGEMANVLWSRQQVVAAIRLEEMWNELAARRPFSLCCAYIMDPLACSSQEASLIERMIGAHTACQADSEFGRLARAVDQAMEQVVGPGSSEIVRVMARAGSGATRLPEVQALVVWLREHMPRVSERVLAVSREIYEGRARLWQDDAVLTA